MSNRNLHSCRRCRLGWDSQSCRPGSPCPPRSHSWTHIGRSSSSTPGCLSSRPCAGCLAQTCGCISQVGHPMEADVPLVLQIVRKEQGCQNRADRSSSGWRSPGSCSAGQFCYEALPVCGQLPQGWRTRRTVWDSCSGQVWISQL